MIDFFSYIFGLIVGKRSGNIILSGSINCTDDGNGNITITEE